MKVEAGNTYEIKFVRDLIMDEFTEDELIGKEYNLWSWQKDDVIEIDVLHVNEVMNTIKMVFGDEYDNIAYRIPIDAFSILGKKVVTTTWEA